MNVNNASPPSFSRRQKDRVEKDVQQVNVTKNREGNVLTREGGVLKRCSVNEEKEKKTDGGQLVNQEVKKFSKERVRAAMQSVKVVQMIHLWRYEDIEHVK